MPTRFNEAHVVCPFYNTSTNQSISCEGVTDDCILKLIFATPRKMQMYRGTFCARKYPQCNIYAMLEKKYE